MVLRIRTGFNAEPVPASYLKADPDPDQGSQTNADPILVRLCRHKELDFDIKNILYGCNTSLNIPTKVQKPFLNAGNQIYAPGSGSAYTDPDTDPEEPKSMRIHVDPDLKD